MPERKKKQQESAQALFEVILHLETQEECAQFFGDLCTMKELSDMAQRLETAKMLLEGKTYEQIVKSVEISTATISRINRCIQYGEGGYQAAIQKVLSAQEPEETVESE